MHTKKTVLKISLIYVAYLVVIFLTSIFCNKDFCSIREDGFLGVILFSFVPLFPLFLLSLITYKMRDQAFRAWWNFARWWVPIIIVATFLLNNASGGGTLGMNQDFTFFILFILYAVLVIVSIVKIWCAHGSSEK